MKFESITHHNIFIKALLFYLSISSLFIAMLYNLTDTVNWIIFKDLPIYIILVVIVVLRKRITKNSLIYLWPLLFSILLNLQNSLAPTFANVAAMRQILTPFILIFIGQYFILNRKNYLEIVKFILLLTIGLILFGFFERFSYFWTFFDLFKYFGAKNTYVLPFGYPFIFLEPINVSFLNNLPEKQYGFPRMVSAILDPINFGHLLVTAFVLVMHEAKYLHLSKATRYVFLIVIFSAIILTVSKGAILQLFFVVIVLNPDIRNVFKIFGILLAFPLITFLISAHPGFMVHINGFISVFHSLNLFGHGLSTYGNYSLMFNPEFGLKDTGVRDSFWGSLLGQLGLVGFIAWLYPFYKIIKTINVNHYLSKLLIAQILVAALSENTFNLLSVTFLMILIGAYYSVVLNKATVQGIR